MKVVEALKLRWVAWVWRHTPNCAEMARLSSLSFEQPPSLKLRLRMRLHHLICVWCERYAKHLKFLHRAAPGLTDQASHDSGRGLSSGAKKRMIDKLHEASGG